MITMKCSSLCRNRLHFLIAHATAKHSSLITAYLLSASVRNLDPACTIFHSVSQPGVFCRSINPIPSVLASVCSDVSFVGSK